jgi:hypothetical protein
MRHRLNDEILLEILTDDLAPKVAEVLRFHHPDCDSIAMDGEVVKILTIFGDWINRPMNEPVEELPEEVVAVGSLSVSDNMDGTDGVDNVDGTEQGSSTENLEESDVSVKPLWRGEQEIVSFE